MSLNVSRFLDLIRAAESRKQREVTMSLQQARDLHSDITRLLLVLEQMRTDSQTASDRTNDLADGVEIQGPGF